jgi:HAD superfamily hydrolase (TIGR01509 family)
LTKPQTQKFNSHRVQNIFTAIKMSEQLSDILNGRKPSIIAFDCDWTLYPYDCDKDRIAPFQKTAYGLVDMWGQRSEPYPDVSSIMSAIVDAEIPVAFLSRNPSADSVENLLRTIPLYSVTRGTLSVWDAMPNRDYFHAYSARSAGGYGKGKDRHFAALMAATGVHPNHILFFDDMKDNIDAAAAQGTTSILLGKPGLTWSAFIAGITGWRERLKKIEAGAVIEEHTDHHGPTERRTQEEGRQGKGEAGAQPILTEACAFSRSGGGEARV